ncbi:hypothetical protein PV325_005426 [Microctonus aethiopoides]|nr:hypothetical protein PV325_005426 [Microctonus aethiopoides]KAK0098412.1 hypothetical protein PV326_008687 [Microctonus aethiopoides]
MGKLWSYLIFLGWICYLMTVGLFLFLNGFFLTRISRIERNNCTTCNSLNNCDIKSILYNSTSTEDICLQPQGRIVLLIVDALKYDFMNWQENIINPPHYQNKIPIVHELINKYPNNAKLYKIIADPPTTTMQRIKGFTTGTLPTFIDISSNFASEQINEDNLIDQNAKNGVVFMGDDTWTGLYPDKFLRQFPSPSFNVWDLDTVDREVKHRIFFELQKKDWSLLIAHTLGVDHCGHKHGQNHPEMSRKLNETNDLIREIIDTLSDDVILFMMGDHGMTETGDHGGDSSNEIEAGLFVYSKKPFISGFETSKTRILNQIDIVPTFSAILGTPIPFSNIGSLIIDILPISKTSRVNTSSFIVHSVLRNIIQTKKYIDAYSSESFLFSDEKLLELNKHYELLIMEAIKIKHDDDESVKKFILNAHEYLKILRDSCVEIWAQFDSKLMLQGLLIMFCTLFFTYLLINGVQEMRMIKIFESAFLQVSTVANIFVGIMVYCLFIIKIIDEFTNTIFLSTGIVSLLLLASVIIQNWDEISNTWYNNSRNKKIDYIMRIVLLLTICGLFSNSYIVEEDKVLSFLLITLVCLLIYNIGDDTIITESHEKKFKSSNKSMNLYKTKILLIFIGFIVCLTIRISSYFWRCREEQINSSCTSSIFLGKVGSISSNSLERILLTISLVALALYITIVRIWLRNCGNLTGFSPTIAVSRYCPGLIVVCMGSYWVLQRLPKNGKVKFVLSYQMNALPGVVYFFVIFAIGVLFIRPLSIFLLPQKRETFSIYQGENMVPKLFDKIKELFYTKRNKDDNDIPIVYGLGTVYSAAFISLSVFLTLLYALLLGNVLAPSSILMIVTCAAVLGIVAIERYRNANDIGQLFQIPSTAIFCWFLIAEYFFYGSGHQPTFSTIYWDAAFIGTGGHYYGNIIPAILIGVNTFGSHIILGATLPLLIIAPFTIFVMIPKLAKIKFRVNEDMKRGELVLFDRESTFHHALVTVCGKYLLIHGLRTFGCMFAATIHCRHLMVWKIFAPKLIFEGLSFLVSLGSVLLSLFMVIRIDGQVEKLIACVTKVR